MVVRTAASEPTDCCKTLRVRSVGRVVLFVVVPLQAIAILDTPICPLAIQNTQCPQTIICEI